MKENMPQIKETGNETKEWECESEVFWQDKKKLEMKHNNKKGIKNKTE